MVQCLTSSGHRKANLELLNYIIELTKGSISQAEKVQLAKQLTDPQIRRKTLGDF